jgi:diguanylate cyclase (GGDEF)-like protein
MNPAQKSSKLPPAASAASGLATFAAEPQSAAEGHGGFGLGLAAVAAGAATAFGMAYALTAVFGPGAAWTAPAAAAVGVLVGVLPLNLVLLRRAREAQAAAGRASPTSTSGMARPLFMDLAQREWARARRYGSGAALVLIDVDRYARLCEARGPHAGDVVLNELLRLTAPSLRPADILTRYSETQIAVLLAQSDATGALDVAERIRERAEQIEVKLESAAAPPQKLRVTVSAGVAHLRPAHLSLQALIDDAEDAVTAARQAGGNCVRSAPVEPGRPRATGTGRSERRAQPNPDGAA